MSVCFIGVRCLRLSAMHVAISVVEPTNELIFVIGLFKVIRHTVV